MAAKLRSKAATKISSCPVYASKQQIEKQESSLFSVLSFYYLYLLK